MADHTVQSVPPALRFVFKWIFPLLFIGAGGGLLAHGLVQLNRAFDSTDWPSTEGTVISSVIQVQVNRSSEGGSRRTYHADITYTYGVDGTSYIGDRVAIGDFGSSNRSHARGVLARYPEGATVDVYYDPADPEISLLEPGVTLKAWFQPGIGALFLIVGIVAFILIRIMFSKAAEATAAIKAGSEEASPHGHNPAGPA